MKKSQLAKTTPAPKVAIPAWRWLPILFGGFIAMMALTQLADFEGFVLALDEYGLTEESGTVTLAIVIAAIEILALPVLFRLSLSRLMRVVSAGAVLLTPLVWLGMTLVAVLGGASPQNAGYFGGLLPQPFYWWSALAMLVILAGMFFALQVLGGKKLLDIR